MPELRSAVRRNRAQQQQLQQGQGEGDQAVVGVQRNRRRRGAAAASAAKELVNQEVDEKGAVRGTEPELREEVADRKMDEYESGGKSVDKVAVAEDEGSTAPLPEKVILFFENFRRDFEFALLVRVQPDGIF